MKKGMLVLLAFILGVVLFSTQRPAEAWPWTKVVDIYGYARVSGPGVDTPCKYVKVYENGRLIATANCSWQGRWYVNKVPVNATYKVVAYGYTSRGWRTNTVSAWVGKPWGYPSNVKIPGSVLRVPYF